MKKIIWSDWLKFPWKVILLNKRCRFTAYQVNLPQQKSCFAIIRLFPWYIHAIFLLDIIFCNQLRFTAENIWIFCRTRGETYHEKKKKQLLWLTAALALTMTVQKNLFRRAQPVIADAVRERTKLSRFHICILFFFPCRFPFRFMRRFPSTHALPNLF